MGNAPKGKPPAKATPTGKTSTAKAPAKAPGQPTGAPTSKRPAAGAQTPPRQAQKTPPRAAPRSAQSAPVEFQARPARAPTRKAPAKPTPVAEPAPKPPAPKVPTGPNIIVSDAPPHWPRVRASIKFLQGKSKAYEKKFLQGVHQALEKQPFLRVVEAPHHLLFPDGILEIPLLVEEADRRIAVMIYPKGNDKDAAHYQGVRKLMQGSGIHVTYYAPKPLAKRGASNPCRGFSLDVMKPLDDTPPGEYATWWATPKDRDFRSSPLRASIKATYQALDGYESRFYAAILRALGGPDVTIETAPLPPEKEGLSIPVQGPGGHTMLIKIDRRKGIRFQFPTDSPARLRDQWWDLVSTYAEAQRTEWRAAYHAKDSYYEDRPLRWLEEVEMLMDKARATGDERDRRFDVNRVEYVARRTAM